jgi:hypothetical protein
MVRFQEGEIDQIDFLASYWRQNGLGVKPNTHLQLVPMLRMLGANPPLPHTSS